MQAITTPNLPRGRVRLAAVSSFYKDIPCALEREGIEVVLVQPVAALPKPVASHSDLQLLHTGGNRLLLAREAGYIQTALNRLGFTTDFIDNSLGDSYPNDVSLNFLLQNDCCFGLCSNMPLELVKHCNYAGLLPVSSKQGYARCSVAVVAPKAAITSDSNLGSLMSANGIDVLMLEPGDIILEGYNTGFIGGCCGLIANDRLALTGSLQSYRQGKKILEFLKGYNVEPVYLREGKLVDIGGIIPLAEDDSIDVAGI